MLPNVQIITNDNGEKYAFATGYGSAAPLLAHQSHPNFNRIVAQWTNDDPQGFAELFDIPEAIERAFARVGERVTVKGDNIYFDGDKVEGSIVDTILGFMDAGEEFGPLVKFFEAVKTNPLGDIAEGLFDWLKGQRESAGNFTITPEGDVLGYKSVYSNGDGTFRPTRGGEVIVNGTPQQGSAVKFAPGDVVEMPRSQIRNTPSAECGVGLHIGTWGYASTFSGDTKLLVKFSPRDVASLPSSTMGSNKLRVRLYTVVDVVTEPLKAALYTPPGASEPQDDGDLDLATAESDYAYARNALATAEMDYDDEAIGESELADAEAAFDAAETAVVAARRTHGKGGPTSQAAKGRGKHPAQDALGRFSAGRPASARDASTGRFA